MLAPKAGDRRAFVKQHAARLAAWPPGVALPLQFHILFLARFAHRGLHRPRCHHFRVNHPSVSPPPHGTPVSFIVSQCVPTGSQDLALAGETVG